MPSTVASIFAAADLRAEGLVQWGTPPPSTASGIYIVSLTNSLDSVDSTLPTPQWSGETFDRWLSTRPDLLLDGASPTPDQLKSRIAGFWLPDEAIVYIGLASSLRARVNAYYNTPIGAPRPHSGGYFLKLLANLPDLIVHYAETTRIKECESRMIEAFCHGVSAATRSLLHDPIHPFPFANLEWPPGVRKAHGLRAACSGGPTRPKMPEKTKSIAAARMPDAVLPPLTKTPTAPEQQSRFSLPPRTQRVTAADLKTGQIRIPAASTSSARALLPSRKDHVTINLRGTQFHCAWDPRVGPDRQRSGILTFGRRLSEHVVENEVLYLSRVDAIVVIE